MITEIKYFESKEVTKEIKTPFYFKDNQFGRYSYYAILNEKTIICVSTEDYSEEVRCMKDPGYYYTLDSIEILKSEFYEQYERATNILKNKLK